MLKFLGTFLIAAGLVKLIIFFIRKARERNTGDH